jgi:hypothetical protein
MSLQELSHSRPALRRPFSIDGGSSHGGGSRGYHDGHYSLLRRRRPDDSAASTMYPLSPNTAAAFDDERPIQIDQPMDLSSLLVPPTTTAQQHQQQQSEQPFQQPQQITYRSGGCPGGIGMRGSIGRALAIRAVAVGRNSEFTFGRAMSGLSALSIDVQYKMENGHPLFDV